MSGEQITRGPHVDSTSAWIYVGGIPNQYVNPEETPVFEGFIGCIQTLIVSTRKKKISVAYIVKLPKVLNLLLLFFFLD